MSVTAEPVGSTHGHFAPRQVRNVDAKPTARQVYAIARGAIELAGLDWPTTREGASQLIQTIMAAKSPAASEEVPF